MNTKNFIVLRALKVSQEDIEGHFRDVFERVEGLLFTKGREYSSDTNRLENFLETARMEDITPEVALWNYMLKHIVSVRKLVFESGTATYPLEMWDEKIGDIETYLILLRAMVHARQKIEEVLNQRLEDNAAPETALEIQTQRKKKESECPDVNNDSLGRDIGHER